MSLDKRIYLLALGPFAFGTGAFSISGLMDPIATDLGVSIGAAGQLSTALALTVAVAAPLLAGPAIRRFGARILPWLVAAFGLACAACAIAPDYVSLLGFRVLAGVAGCLISAFSSTTAAMLAPPEQRARALAIVFAGTSLSFVVGAPLSIAIGATFGWRMLFVFGAVVALASAFVLRGVAAHAGPQPAAAQATPLPWADAFAPLAYTALAFAATMASIAYLGPLVTATTGLTGASIGAVQCLIGLGSLSGLFLSARFLAPLKAGPAILFAIIAITQAIYVPLVATPLQGGLELIVMGGVTFIGAGALFGMMPLAQSRLVAVGGPNAGVLMALNGSMIFLGQSIGTAAGGATIDTAGLAWTGAAGAAIALIGLGIGLLAAARRPRIALAAAPA